MDNYCRYMSGVRDIASLSRLIRIKASRKLELSMTPCTFDIAT